MGAPVHAFLQIALDPRTVFALGLLFFGGIVAWAEITHFLARRKRRSEAERPRDDDPPDR